MTSREYGDYLQDILNSIADIESFIKNMSRNQFENDRKTINAVVRSLEIIGEAVKNLPESFRKKYPEIPWKKIAGMRDKLIHQYHAVDLEIIWQAINQEIPSIKTHFKKIYKAQ